jgi:hypothetical protein
LSITKVPSPFAFLISVIPAGEIQQKHHYLVLSSIDLLRI